jgi:hypothetical protein
MHALDKTAWEILNATADDWENLEQIYQMVCFDFSPELYENRDRNTYYLRSAQGAPSLEEIADHTLNLVEAGLFAARQGEVGSPVSDLKDRSYVWRAWFRMTPAGKELWESSEYSNLVKHE